jgi:hypothetical protein
MEKERAKFLRKLILCIFMLTVGLLPAGSPAYGWSWGEQPFAVVNGKEFYGEDFKDWFRYWQEDGSALPATPDSFIEWQLMATEAENMQLDHDPQFQRKTSIYLKVQSLMLLKYEEVDKKVAIHKSKLWDEYEQKYCPRWLVHIFFFKDEKVAEYQATALRNKEITFEELAAIVEKDGGPLQYKKSEARQPMMKGEFLEILKKAKPGGFYGPVKDRQGYVVVLTEKKLAPDQEDFEKLKKKITKILFKKEQGRLTYELIEKFKEQYEVKVDEVLLASLVEDKKPSPEESAKIVIHNNKQPITLGQVWGQVEKSTRFNRKNKFKVREYSEQVQWVVQNILSQTLTTWGALDRHYENTDLLRAKYNFYRRHQLVKALQKKFVEPKVLVEPAELEVFYQKNIDQFAQPEMVSLVMLEGEEKILDKLWGEIAAGRKFMEVAEEIFPGNLTPRDLAYNHLGSDLRAVVDSLHKGEISRPFQYGENFAVVKLLEKKTSVPFPFKKVRSQIERDLRKIKYEQARNSLVTQLKNGSAIMINDKAWQSLVEDYNEK